MRLGVLEQPMQFMRPDAVYETSSATPEESLRDIPGQGRRARWLLRPEHVDLVAGWDRGCS